jgi:hypothetical protein
MTDTLRRLLRTPQGACGLVLLLALAMRRRPGAGAVRH